MDFYQPLSKLGIEVQIGKEIPIEIRAGVIVRKPSIQCVIRSFEEMPVRFDPKFELSEATDLRTEPKNELERKAVLTSQCVDLVFERRPRPVSFEDKVAGLACVGKADSFDRY